MTDDEKIKLLSSNGMLIKRPIVFGDGKATVGFKEEEFEKVWGLMAANLVFTASIMALLD